MTLGGAVNRRAAPLSFKQARPQADKTGNQVTGGNALAGRPSRFVVALELAGLAGAIALALFTSADANWNLPLLAVLLTLSVLSDVAAVDTKGQVKISGSFLSLVLAMVFLGGPPAALIGAATIVVGWLRWRDDWHFFINNLTAYVIFPLVSGLAFRDVTEAAGLGTSDGFFYLLVCGVFLFGERVGEVCEKPLDVAGAEQPRDLAHQHR